MAVGTNNTLSNQTDNIHLKNTVDFYQIMLGIFLFLVVVITIVGNVMVLIAVSQNKRLRTSFNYYIVNLAVTDVAVAVTAMSFFTINNVLGYWPFGEFMCGVWIFFDYGMTFESVFTLILISLDRFWSITWSLHYRKHNTRRKSLIFITISWLFMLCLWVPPFIWDRMKNGKADECKWEPADNLAFVFVIAIIGHHGSCLILLFCYIKVFTFMRQRMQVFPANNKHTTVSTRTHVSAISQSVSSHAVHTLETSGGRVDHDEYGTGTTTRQSLRVPESDSKLHVRHPLAIVSEPVSSGSRVQTTMKSTKESKEKRVIFITLTYVVVGYMVCWVPFHIVFDISAINPMLVPEYIYTMTFWMAYINSTINPCLYNLSNSEFRRAFKKMICCCR